MMEGIICIYIIIINSLESMCQCPLCQSYTIQAYLNIVQLYSLCTKCTRRLQSHTKASQFVFKSLIKQHLTSTIVTNNQSLKQYKKTYQKSSPKDPCFSRMLQGFVEENKNDKEDSTNLTISSQTAYDSKLLFDMPESQLTISSIVSKCKYMVKAIEIQSFKDKIQQTKLRMWQSSSTINSHLRRLQNNINSLKIQLPNLTTAAGQSVKAGFSFLRKLF